jgi:hypothetical protein
MDSWYTSSRLVRVWELISKSLFTIDSSTSRALKFFIVMTRNCEESWLPKTFKS